MHLEENVLLAPFTTLRIGGPARYFVRVTDEEQLLEVVRFARERHLPLFTLGGGSNLVVADEGFPGVVVQMGIDGPIETQGETKRRYAVPAGHDWDGFVLAMCQAGLTGVECLAGIPGRVGGSPIQNIGAYGQEVAQTIHSVRLLDLETQQYQELSAAECGFGYRTSIFNTTHRSRFLVTRVVFEFDPDARPILTYAELKNHFVGHPEPKPLEIYQAVRRIRAAKGMLIDPANPTADTRSAGSFFKNPVVPAASLTGIAAALGIAPETIPHWPVAGASFKLPAAWLIERAGFPKGYALHPESPVGISSRHTLALVNRTGSASCADLLELRDFLAAGVFRRFGIVLEQEPVSLG